MRFIVYKTTNLINKKFYLGAHDTQSQPNYIGSGFTLKHAIEKYGRNNFVRETLAEFDTAEEMYEYEAWLINKVMVNRPDCYNMIIGGRGGPRGKRKERTIEHRVKLSDSLRGREVWNAGKTGIQSHSLETRLKMGKTRKGKKQSLSTCPHCLKTGGSQTMPRWHFDNCKNLTKENT